MRKAKITLGWKNKSSIFGHILAKKIFFALGCLFWQTNWKVGPLMLKSWDQTGLEKTVTYYGNFLSSTNWGDFSLMKPPQPLKLPMVQKWRRLRRPPPLPCFSSLCLGQAWLWTSPGLIADSILFCLLFVKKDYCKKVFNCSSCSSLAKHGTSISQYHCISVGEDWIRMHACFGTFLSPLPPWTQNDIIVTT